MTFRPAFGLLLIFVASLRLSWGQEPSLQEKRGEIHGRITLSAGQGRAAVRAGQPRVDRYHLHGDHGSMGSPGAALSDTTPPALSEQTVVYLEGRSLEGQSYPVPSLHPALNQRGIQFHPQVLPVQAGTTVDFPNRDNLYHNVFSYSSSNEFDLGRYPLNDSRSVRFDRPGIVRVYCDIHSHMSATILVLAHPHFAVPDAEGNYTLPELPEGKYTLVVWFGREVAERVQVTVTQGQRQEINFIL
jgi:plastocyanin